MRRFKLLLLFYLSVSFLTVGCVEEEKITPLYEEQAYEAPPEVRKTLQFYPNLDPILIEASKIHKALGRIPLIGDIIQLPVNFLFMLLPDLSAENTHDLPENADWGNPETLEAIEFARIKRFQLKLYPEDPNAEVCFLWKIRCKDPKANIVSKMEIVFRYKTGEQKVNIHRVGPKRGQVKNVEDLYEEIKLATSREPVVTEKNELIINFDILLENVFELLALFDDYPDAEIRVQTKGKPPKVNYLVEGNSEIEVGLKLSLDDEI